MSRLEETLAFQLRAAGLPEPVREAAIVPGRRFRLDFYWPSVELGAEVDGGVHAGGRHVRGSGVERDAEKYSLLAAQGVRVMRLTGRMVKNGRALELLELALRESPVSSRNGAGNG